MDFGYKRAEVSKLNPNFLQILNKINLKIVPRIETPTSISFSTNQFVVDEEVRIQWDEKKDELLLLAIPSTRVGSPIHNRTFDLSSQMMSLLITSFSNSNIGIETDKKSYVLIRNVYKNNFK